LFNKAAVFTDIHFGNKNNSKVHNQDCEDFVDWYIETAQANGCEVGIFVVIGITIATVLTSQPWMLVSEA